MNTLFYSPERLSSIMDKTGVAGLIATTAPNIQYLTGYRRGGDSLALVCRNDITHPELFVHSSNIDFCLEDPIECVRIHPFGFFAREISVETELDERENFIKNLHTHTRVNANGWQLLAETLQSAGVKNASIVTDGSIEGAGPLIQLLPELKLLSRPDLFRQMRTIKTSEEIKRLSEAARITESAIFTSAQSACLGTTQRHLARLFAQTVLSSNAYLRSDNASVDRGTALGNLNSPRDIVREGSIIRYDVGVHYAGYASDMARCFVFRNASDKQMLIHNALVAGLEKELECIRPGIAACDVFDTTLNYVRKSGIPNYERHHVGHGIGIAGAGYEPPLLGPDNKAVLEPGMILCVETPYVELGFGCLHVEDMLLVTSDGYSLLTHSGRSLQLLP
ncbi:MAG: M24 family metallopeptidase [Acidobacteriaceae bacterium]